MKAMALAGFACLGAVLIGCGSGDGGDDRPDSAPPQLLRTDPPDDVVGVAADQIIAATFSESIDASSLDSTRFTLHDASGALVAGRISASGRTVRFEPASALSPSTRHTATLSGTITDRAGNPLGADVTWQFVTETDAWEPTATAGSVPQGRTRHTAAWTGAEMIVWGGQTASGQLTSTGGRYDPTSDQWVSTPDSSAPLARRDHTAVWTGAEMIVWGGELESREVANTGGRYRPGAPAWTATVNAPASDVPSPRRDHTALWTGTEMIVWGGRDELQFLSTGARYRPADDTWSPVSAANAPQARIRHTAVWTGEEMIVWGGELEGGQLTNTGARYRPSTNTWASLPASGAPLARRDHAAVWTGTEMIIWGGEIQGGQLTHTGARYDPLTNTWTPVSPLPAPAARTAHTAVWTGYEMIVWGGTDGVVGSTGVRYRPVSDSWRETASAGAPEERFDHTAVWTGQEMIVWGGATGRERTSTGGRYIP